MQFYRHLRGSLFELMNQVDTDLDCEYIDENYSNKIVDKIQILTLNGYTRYLKEYRRRA